MEMDHSLEKMLLDKLKINQEEFQDDEDMPVIVNENDQFINFD